MTWVRLDDSFTDHPKVDGLSDAAFRLHVAGLCHSARFLTDGFVAASRVDRLVRRYKPALTAELVAAGAWDARPEGWQIHDYTEWNPDAATVRDVQAKRATAGSKGGTKKASNRLANATAGAKANAVAKRKQTSSTNPSYIETPTESLEKSASADEKPCRRVARLHWEASNPKPVLSGGFPALMKLAERFLDAGHSEADVLDALSRTASYTNDAVTFAFRKSASNGKTQAGNVLDAFVAKAVDR